MKLRGQVLQIILHLLVKTKALLGQRFPSFGKNEFQDGQNDASDEIDRVSTSDNSTPSGEN